MAKLMIIIRSKPTDSFRVVEALRLSAAMLGMDQPPSIVFLDRGIECLREGAFDDPVIHDYLRAAADLAGIHVLSESLEEHGILYEELDPSLGAAPLDLEGLAGMMSEHDSVVAL